MKSLRSKLVGALVGIAGFIGVANAEQVIVYEAVGGSSQLVSASFAVNREQYLVEMRLVPSVRPASPEAGIALVENYIFPTLEMCTKLREQKKIVAGGPISATIGIVMIVEAASARELDELVEHLPAWPLMETTVTPLTTFEDRIRAIRPRLERDKESARDKETGRR